MFFIAVNFLRAIKFIFRILVTSELGQFLQESSCSIYNKVLLETNKTYVLF